MPKVRIKKGSPIFHDFAFGKWPACKPPSDEYDNGAYEYITKFPDAFFDAEWTGKYWNCIRDGYGSKNNYGNGSIFVYEKDGVEILHQETNT